MKQLTIIYDSSIEASIKELLDALEVPGITWIYDVPGRGGRGAKMNSPVFPGSNNIAILVLTPEGVARVQRAIRRLQESFRLKPGVTLLCQDVEVLP
ncbi:MAG: PG0541 family transporter-associated protein [Actinomycetota bacterium]